MLDGKESIIMRTHEYIKPLYLRSLYFKGLELYPNTIGIINKQTSTGPFTGNTGSGSWSNSSRNHSNISSRRNHKASFGSTSQRFVTYIFYYFSSSSARHFWGTSASTSDCGIHNYCTRIYHQFRHLQHSSRRIRHPLAEHPSLIHPDRHPHRHRHRPWL